ncbi:MAG: hypothetical protein Q9M76_04430 [Candidatus Dojkabacteria bacterium]|nr:hypothetical protein [Candidatus Dojkabacteria bacterium]
MIKIKIVLLIVIGVCVLLALSVLTYIQYKEKTLFKDGIEIALDGIEPKLPLTSKEEGDIEYLNQAWAGGSFERNYIRISKTEEKEILEIIKFNFGGLEDEYPYLLISSTEGIQLGTYISYFDCKEYYIDTGNCKDLIK